MTKNHLKSYQSCDTAAVHVGLCILPRTTPHRPAWTFSATPCNWSTAFRLGLRRSSSTRSRSNSLLYSASRTEQKCGSSSVSLNWQKSCKIKSLGSLEVKLTEPLTSALQPHGKLPASPSKHQVLLFSLEGRFHMFQFRSRSMFWWLWIRASSSCLKAKMWHGHRLGSSGSTWDREKFGVANQKSAVSALLRMRMDLSNAKVNMHTCGYMRDIAGQGGHQSRCRFPSSGSREKSTKISLVSAGDLCVGAEADWLSCKKSLTHNQPISNNIKYAQLPNVSQYLCQMNSKVLQIVA